VWKPHRGIGSPGRTHRGCSLPDRESLKGKRDYAILVLLLCCGLRRMELVPEVMVGAIAQRENRWVLVDITGKGNRFAPLPSGPGSK
jgi:site-specific recombinase XerD